MSWTSENPIGFDPCGIAFGMVRKPYNSACRFFADEVRGDNRIFWYEVPSDTPFYTGWTVFWPRQDDDDDISTNVYEETGKRGIFKRRRPSPVFAPPPPHAVHGDDDDFRGRSLLGKYGPHPHDPCVIPEVLTFGVKLGDRLVSVPVMAPETFRLSLKLSDGPPITPIKIAAGLVALDSSGDVQPAAAFVEVWNPLVAPGKVGIAGCQTTGPAQGQIELPGQAIDNPGVGLWGGPNYAQGRSLANLVIAPPTQHGEGVRHPCDDISEMAPLALGPSVVHVQLTEIVSSLPLANSNTLGGYIAVEGVMIVWVFYTARSNPAVHPVMKWQGTEMNNGLGGPLLCPVGDDGEEFFLNFWWVRTGTEIGDLKIMFDDVDDLAYMDFQIVHVYGATTIHATEGQVGDTDVPTLDGIDSAGISPEVIESCVLLVNRAGTPVFTGGITLYGGPGDMVAPVFLMGQARGFRNIPDGPYNTGFTVEGITCNAWAVISVRIH